MEWKYIFAIVVLISFFLLVLVSFAFLEYGRIKEERLQAWIKERYADKDLNKYDYDNVTSDDEVVAHSVDETQTDDAESKEEPVEEVQQVQAVPDKLEVEGIEEITGNYNGDNL